MVGARAKLEQELAARFGLAGAVAAGFGRGALWLALEALEVAGGEVLCPDFICQQVPDAVRRARARPVSYPVQCDLGVAPEELAAAITPRTRAALVVHYFGRAQENTGTLAALCRERGVALIEDCALALGAGGAGEHGDLAVFSFTKSDWCYGGGAGAARDPSLLERLREKQHELVTYPELARSYGLLRQLDWAANRPRWARRAERAGPWAQKLLPGVPRDGDFYSAGRDDAAMPEFAARRAQAILGVLDETNARRRAIVASLRDQAGDAVEFLWTGGNESAETAAFLPLVCPPDRAEKWREGSAAHGVTLRRTWPAYQPLAPGQTRDTLTWLGERLLVMEIHPALAPAEISHIVQTLRTLAVE